MRTVLDTNVTISGLLWGGPPHRLIDAAIQGAIELFTSSVLLRLSALRKPKQRAVMEVLEAMLAQASR